MEGVTHDYIRHGTTTLFAALDVATGAVIAECKPRHRPQEFLSFLRRIDKEVPKDLRAALKSGLVALGGAAALGSLGGP